MQWLVARARIAKWIVCCGCVASVPLSAGRVHAEESQAPPAPVLVPPNLKSSLEVPYPDGAAGSEDVVLTLLIGEDGAVREVRRVEGREPFATKAREASAAWLFDPARRGDVPATALVRLLVHFEEKKIEVPEPELPALEAPPALPETKPSPPKGAVEDVVIRGAYAPAPQVTTLSRGEVRQLPGAFGDPFRALDVLPGVVPTLSGFPFFYVRGAPPGNVGYYLDGVRVPYLYHFGLGPSVIHPGIVDRVDLFAGAFPAMWGRYAGAIVAAETVTPRDRFVEANIRLVDAGALAETKIGDKWHVLAGARYSYTAALLSLFAPDVTLDYRDYQARVTYDLSDRERLSLFMFGAYDLVANEDKTRTEINETTGATSVTRERTVLFASEFHRADIRYDRILQSGGKLRAATTFGFDRTRIEGNRFARDFLIGARANVEQPLSRELTLRAGGDLTNDIYAGDPVSPYSVSEREFENSRELFEPRVDYVASLYAEAHAKLGDRLELTPGLRGDLFGSKGNRSPSLDPRMSGKVHVTKQLRFQFAHGTAHQPVTFPIPIPALAIAGLPRGLQTIYQTSGGIELDLPWDTTATANLWKNSFSNVNDFIATNNTQEEDDSPFSTSSSKKTRGGYAYGLEFMLRRKLTKSVGGLVSYTLSRNERLIDKKFQASPFDRTHVFNTAISVDLGRNWRLGGRFLLYTGWPQVDAFAQRTGIRLPTFYRIDARLEKKWKWQNGVWLAFVLEGLNVSLNKETVRYSCDGNRGCKPDEFGPVTVPSIGLEGGI